MAFGMGQGHGSSTPQYRRVGKGQPRMPGWLLMKYSPEERQEEIRGVEWDGKAKSAAPPFLTAQQH